MFHIPATYAIVQFQDLPVIIFEGWLNDTKTSVALPDRSSQDYHNFLLARKLPKKNWVSAPIQQLLEFGIESVGAVS